MSVLADKDKQFIAGTYNRFPVEIHIYRVWGIGAFT